jgi:ABC-type nickel/cobalt efflux system permease component RcnA
MANFLALLKLMKYVPAAYNIVKTVMPSAQADQRSETREELEHFQRTVSDRLSDMEEEIARLRARVREVESLATGLQVGLWIGGGALFVLFIILLILVYPRG